MSFFKKVLSVKLYLNTITLAHQDLEELGEWQANFHYK